LNGERPNLNKREARQRAVALLSGIVGAVVLSRAVKKGHPKLSDELLGSARKQICKQEAHESGLCPPLGRCPHELVGCALPQILAWTCRPWHCGRVPVFSATNNKEI
jgi:hypothetical protein